MKHFKFLINDAKQLTIAMTGAFSTWAATGFARDTGHLAYVAIAFVTGALVSHNSMSSPNVMPDSHVMTPYVNNINDGSKAVPNLSNPQAEYKPEGTDIKKVIQINSGLIK